MFPIGHWAAWTLPNRREDEVPWLGLARITNHPTISITNMTTTLDRRTSIDLFILNSSHILRS